MKVSLYLSVKQDGKWKYLPAAWDGKKLRPFYALVNGRAKEFPGASYYMRYRENGKQKMEPVGNDPKLAVQRQISCEADLRHAALEPEPVEVPAVVAPVPASNNEPQTLADAIKSYELYLQGSEKDFKTIQAYMTTLNGFQEFMKSGKMLHDVTKYDLLNFNLHLRSQKKPNSPRTRRNKLLNLTIFLKHYKITKVIKKSELPKVPHKDVVTHSADERQKLYTACLTEDERDLLTFFYGTGHRDSDAMHTEYGDLRDGELHIKDKPNMVCPCHLQRGWSPKHGHVGEVPVSDEFIKMLRDRKKRLGKSTNVKWDLVFPDENGNPKEHLLRDAKRIGERCGVEVTLPICRMLH